MKTIEVIRLENYKRLVAELGDGVKPPAIARALGISTVYAWQLENGKRDSIDSKAARRIERNADREPGWLDNDPALWPFKLLQWDRVSLLTPSELGMLEVTVIREAKSLQIDLVPESLPPIQGEVLSHESTSKEWLPPVTRQTGSPKLVKHTSTGGGLVEFVQANNPPARGKSRERSKSESKNG